MFRIATSYYIPLDAYLTAKFNEKIILDLSPSHQVLVKKLEKMHEALWKLKLRCSVPLLMSRQTFLRPLERSC